MDASEVSHKRAIVVGQKSANDGVSAAWRAKATILQGTGKIVGKERKRVLDGGLSLRAAKNPYSWT